MEPTSISRLEEFCRQKGISSLTDLAKQIGASTGTFSIIKKRGARPGNKVMDMLITKFPDLSREWVLDGIGTMFRNNQRLTPALTASRTTDEGPEPPTPTAAGPVLSFNVDALPLEQQVAHWRAIAQSLERERELGQRREEKLLDRIDRFSPASAEAAAPRPTIESTINAPRLEVAGLVRYPEAAHYSITGEKLAA